ncbi:hypothetical protein QFZ82_002242 [Streptomyces sp. V4I23]|uniref:TauD/TfdA family dioxygenase n=1 Tax=Streptomyces sp. V4I23 TaxID=3042282 RepID=UPI002787B281|nr:TauD/TfdA family dioxygenase [Streptomyces sp. V4I23]MDQ1007757.1 hypothetical protein [Streptomyces sp. V4I23]
MNDLTGITVIEAHGGELGSFVHRYARAIDEAVAATGAVLIREAAADGVGAFQRALDAMGFSPLEYTERSTPRSEVGDGVFTSTEYPAREVIPQHCESSYAGAWPGRLAFFCATSAETGGATPVTDVAGVLEDIPSEVVEAVETRGLRYVRNYGSGVGLDWREAFQAASREEVDRFCAAGGLERPGRPYGDGPPDAYGGGPVRQGRRAPAGLAPSTAPRGTCAATARGRTTSRASTTSRWPERAAPENLRWRVNLTRDLPL